MVRKTYRRKDKKKRERFRHTITTIVKATNKTDELEKDRKNYSEEKNYKQDKYDGYIKKKSKTGYEF